MKIRKRSVNRVYELALFRARGFPSQNALISSSFVLSLHLSIIFRHFRYKDFLVNLTPVEWKDQKREEKKQRKLHRRRIAATGLFLYFLNLENVFQPRRGKHVNLNSRK